MPKTIPTDIPITQSASDDYMIFSDTSDSNKIKRDTVDDIVHESLTRGDADMLPDGATNRYMTNAEKTKLAGIENDAEVNQVNSVQGQQGVISLTLDDIPDGSTRKAGDAIYTTVEDGQLGTAYSHSQTITGNPHNVTASQVGLPNVANERQLSRTADNFSALPEKSDIQFHLDDLTVLQDSSDSENIKKVLNQTNLIWYAGYIQTRGPSINYNSFNFSGSTSYNIHSIVTVGSSIYKCIVSHQSSNFASDLASGYRVLIGGGSGTVPINISVGSGAPIGVGVNPGDLYIDFDSGDLYIRNGTTWLLNGGGGGGVNFDTNPTIGNRVTFSVGTGADLIEETQIEVDPVTGDILFPNTIEVTFESDVNFNNNEVNYNNSEVNFDSNSEVNMYGDTFIENLEIENIILGPNPDLTDLISTDVNNQLTTGSDDKLFVPPISVNRGSIGGTLSSQTDLQNALNAKVTGPASATNNNIPQFDGTSGKLIKDGLGIVTTVGSPGSDSNIPTEQAVREAISTVDIADLVAPGDDLIINNNDSEKNVTGSPNGTLGAAVLMKSVEVNKEFMYNISYEGRSSSGVNDVYFAVIINGSTVISTTGATSSGYITYTATYYASIGDVIGIYWWNKSGGTPSAFCQNFRLLATPVVKSTGIGTNIVT